mgnify:CR=1 FL=1
MNIKCVCAVWDCLCDIGSCSGLTLQCHTDHLPCLKYHYCSQNSWEVSAITDITSLPIAAQMCNKHIGRQQRINNGGVMEEGSPTPAQGLVGGQASELSLNSRCAHGEKTPVNIVNNG